MCDFTISSSTREVSRRNLLTVLAGSVSLSNLAKADGLPVSMNDENSIALWHRWFVAHQNLTEAVSRQQRLEASLFTRFGSPSRVSNEIWEQAADETGYRAALETEALASDVNGHFAQTLWSTPANGIPGVTAKLHAILLEGRPSVDTDEFPWPQIRYVVGDLIKIMDDESHLDRMQKFSR